MIIGHLSFTHESGFLPPRRFGPSFFIFIFIFIFLHLSSLTH